MNPSILTSHLTPHEQVLGHQVSDDHLPDVNLIGEMGDVTELGKLVQLVLAPWFAWTGRRTLHHHLHLLFAPL